MLRTNLPQEIITPDGTRLVPIVGVPRNVLIDEIRKRRCKYRTVEVLSRNLRGRTDLHGHPYTPNRFIMSEPSMNAFVDEWQANHRNK